MNKLKHSFLIVVLIITGVYSLYAQPSIANYANVRNTGVGYASINAFGNAFNSWRNTTSFTQDDNRSDFTDIGFDFWYNGDRYTQFCVSTNGFIDFSNSTDDGGPVADDFGYNNAAFTAANINNATRPAIAPFYDDLTAQGGTDPLGNSIKYYLSGSAPNRTLTIEWINMAVYLNTTPSLNFQVKLVETTGRIIVHYGTMNSGTQIFSYGMGLNGPTMNATPTAAQLKMLQTVNTNVLNNTVQNNLSGMPAANSQYIFTPPVPTPTAGTLTFSGVSQSSMTLNWTNWASNEVGYVIYNSTDGTNFNFVTQTAMNATSTSVTGLLPGTTYYWRLYAVTEGCLSSPLNGTQATSSGGNKVSNASGNWTVATIWTPNGVPTAGDNVTISNGHMVSIVGANAVCNNLTVGGGTAATLQFSGNASRTLTVNNNLTINTSARFQVPTNSNATHALAINGNISNNNIINFASDGNSLCNVVLSKNGNQTLSGTGTTNAFNLIALNLGSNANNTFEVSTPNFTAPTNFLTLSNGTFKLSTANAVNITPFTGAVTLPQTTGIWVNSANATLNTGAGVTLSGRITVSNGTLNIGNAANEDLLSSGGSINVSGGALNIAGKFYSTGINNLSYFSISGGTVTVPAFGSTSTTDAPFQMAGVGSQFTMSGGLIVIPREGGSGAQDLGYINTGSILNTVTGGTLQIGNSATPAGQTMNINSSAPVGNIVVGSSNATARLNTNSLSLINRVIISSGTLNANNLGISLGGNWQNNGGTFTPGTGTVTFNGSSAQSIFKSGGETFNHLSFSGSGVKTFSSAVSALGNVSIAGGSSVDVSTSNHQLSLRGNFINSGTFNARSGLVFLNGTTAQTIGGSSTTNFFDLTLNNNAGATLTNSENLISTLTLNNGNFNANGLLTMVSTATATARIAQITGSGNITGNVIVQRFAPGGTTGWALIGTPISTGLTLNDWDDDIYISCATCPDGDAGGFISIYTYDETPPGLYDDWASYIPMNTINDPIVPGKGYWVYLGDGQFTTNNIIIDVTGNVRKFNYTIPLNYTNHGSPSDDGWNLIHNPYPSPISWAALKGATSNIDDAIYVYNADLNGGSGGFASYVNGVSSPAVGAGGIGNTIPMFQGFYVHSTGATGLNAQESNKVAGNPTFLKTSASASSNPLLRINLHGANGFTDETVLYTQPGASDGFDVDYDSYKMRGQDPYAPIIALQKTVNDFQINGVAPISGNFSIPLKTVTGYPGTYTISISNFSTFPTGACINLFDKYNSTTTNLKTSNYVFTLSDTTQAPRFNLNITINPLAINANVTQPDCSAPNDGQITAIGNSSGPWNYYWTNASGTLIKTSLNKSSADTLKTTSGGKYNLEVNTVGACDNNTSSFNINTIVAPTSQFYCVDTVYLNSGGFVQFSNASVNAIQYQWDFGDNAGFSMLPSPAYNYTATGIYTVSLICTSTSGCSDVSHKLVTVLNTDIGIASTGGGNPHGLLLKTIGNNEFLLEQEIPEALEHTYKIYDELGKLIIDLGGITSKTVSLPINLKSYKPGVYFLTITSESGQITLKLPVR